MPEKLVDGRFNVAWDHPDPFAIEITVKPQEIDDFQHTNNVIYVGWMSRVAWAHSKSLGLDFEAYRRVGKGVVVLRHEIDYIKPSYENDTVLLATWITRNDGRLRMRRRFQMLRVLPGTTQTETIARGATDFVCIDIASGRPKRMPPEFVETYKVMAPVD